MLCSMVEGVRVVDPTDRRDPPQPGPTKKKKRRGGRPPKRDSLRNSLGAKV